MSVEVLDHGRVRVVTINRPEVRNAVNPATARALYDAFLGVEANDDVDAAVLTGAAGAFCAGFDLKAAADGSARDWIREVALRGSGWQNARTEPRPGPMGPSRLMLSKPVVAAIEGPAVAGGLELAAWCDMRVVAKGAVLGVYCRRWGVPLIDGGTVRLPAILGQGRANDLILTGRGVETTEAQSMGLADRITGEGMALETAIELANSLTKFPQGCMRADHLAARMPGAELAAALTREWRSARVFENEGLTGAARFAEGHGRGGRFDDI